jgi:hypothetical protein
MKQFGINAIQINCSSIPKFILKNVISIFILGSVLTTIGYAQSASATWQSPADTTTIAAVVTGNITAPEQVLSKTPIASDTMTVRDYVGGTTTPDSPVGLAQRVWCNGSLMPRETSQNNGRYIQYSVSPIPGNKLTVTSISLNIGGFGSTDKIFANIAYSTDSTFATKTQLNASALTLVDMRTTPLAALSYTPSVLIDTGETFYVRIYPWYGTNDASGGKCVCITDFVISGTTAVVGEPSLIVAPASLSFGSAKVSTSIDRSFSISGVLLSPASGDITITAPANFAVLITKGSGYSSSITVSYTGGTLNNTTIYTRFTPTTAAPYMDSILVSGGGVSTQKVVVTGTGVASDVVMGIFVSLTGSDDSTGSFEKPFRTITKAVSVAQAGDTIFVRGGTYSLTTTIGISKSGASDSRFYLFAYPDDAERPLLDYTSQALGSKGISLSGNYWHIKGFDIYKAGDNGMYISGSNNIIEFCAVYENNDTGLQLGGGASNNQIINCDSYYNYDSNSDSTKDGANADGFSPKMDVGTGNYFYGCRSWLNSDDGFDGYLRGATGVTTTLENCWTFRNGYRKDGTNPGSQANGNGFKMGGSDTKDLVHNFIVKNCLSFNNKVKGFDQNSNAGSITLYNCTAYNNSGQDYMLNSQTGVVYDPTSVFTVINCAALGTIGTSFRTETILTTNNFLTSTSDYVSIDTIGVTGARKPDGSLPDITFMHLAAGSDLVNTGTNVGLPYFGTAPDLGCFETSVLTGVIDQSNASIPNAFTLSQNYPNPFNPSTVIRFSVKEKGSTTLKVFDVLGKEVATLFNETAVPNQYYTRTFEASRLSSGIYFSVLQTGVQREVKKMVLMK